MLRKLDQIECRDALVDQMPDGTWVEAHWPEADFIVGNPPFLGAKLMKRKLGVQETEQLRAVYRNRLAGFSDLVCFWFLKATKALENGTTEAVGFVATSSIRGGTNRPILDAITKQHRIFEAWSEQPWIIEGARVEVSLICFRKKEEFVHTLLNGREVPLINADLTSGINFTLARKLAQNRGISLFGIQSSGPHDVSGALARDWMSLPTNPNGATNASVLKPYWNGDDITGRPRDVLLIDLPIGLAEKDATLYEGVLYTCLTQPGKYANVSKSKEMPRATEF